MRDNVPYDIYVTENAKDEYRHKDEHRTNNKVKASLDCMDDLQKGQQVIIICKSKIKSNTVWTGIAYERFVRMKNRLYQRDRKACSTKREFVARWHTVKSDSYNKKLRTNQHLGIERIR